MNLSDWPLYPLYLELRLSQSYLGVNYIRAFQTAKLRDVLGLAGAVQALDQQPPAANSLIHPLVLLGHRELIIFCVFQKLKNIGNIKLN